MRYGNLGSPLRRTFKEEVFRDDNEASSPVAIWDKDTNDAAAGPRPVGIGRSSTLNTMAGYLVTDIKEDPGLNWISARAPIPAASTMFQISIACRASGHASSAFDRSAPGIISVPETGNVSLHQYWDLEFQTEAANVSFKTPTMLPWN